MADKKNEVNDKGAGAASLSPLEASGEGGVSIGATESNLPLVPVPSDANGPVGPTMPSDSSPPAAKIINMTAAAVVNTAATANRQIHRATSAEANVSSKPNRDEPGANSKKSVASPADGNEPDVRASQQSTQSNDTNAKPKAKSHVLSAESGSATGAGSSAGLRQDRKLGAEAGQATGIGTAGGVAGGWAIGIEERDATPQETRAEVPGSVDSDVRSSGEPSTTSGATGNAVGSSSIKGISPSPIVGARTETPNDLPTPIDKLGFGPYVEGLAEFLLNKHTEPPLTMSIEGRWGSGKSSFMSQLCKELRRRSQTPSVDRIGNPHFVGFSPWRHETDESLWASFALAFIRQCEPQNVLTRVGYGLWLSWRLYDHRKRWGHIAVTVAALMLIIVTVFLVGKNLFFPHLDDDTILTTLNLWIAYVRRWWPLATSAVTVQPATGRNGQGPWRQCCHGKGQGTGSAQPRVLDGRRSGVREGLAQTAGILRATGP